MASEIATDPCPSFCWLNALGASDPWAPDCWLYAFWFDKTHSDKQFRVPCSFKPAERERAAASDHCVPDGLLDTFGLVGASGGHESHRDKLLCDHSLFWMTPSNKESASEEGGQPSERKHADITVTNVSELDSEDLRVIVGHGSLWFRPVASEIATDPCPSFCWLDALGASDPWAPDCWLYAFWFDKTHSDKQFRVPCSFKPA